MKLCVFTVYDSKADCYLQPIYFKSKGEAIRSFSDECNRSESQMNVHAEDFTLFQLGEFDDSNASFDLLVTPVAIGKAIEFIKS